MQVERQPSARGYEVTAAGRLDAQYADVLAHELEECMRGGSHSVYLNLSRVDYLSSAGIRILVRYGKTLRSLGGGLILTGSSAMVTNVLTMAGMMPLFTAPRAQEATAVAPAEQRLGSISYRVVNRRDGAMRVRQIGDPAKLAAGGYDASDCVAITLAPDDLAVGIAAFARDYADGRGRFGEFLAAGGVAVCLPPDASGIPDFMITQGELRPEVQALQALLLSGSPSAQVRFEARDPIQEPADLASLAAVMCEVVKAPQVAMVMVAETDGLVGASLRRSPVERQGSADPFSLPELRRWLSYTPERVHGRHLALITGVIAARTEPWLAPSLRPLGSGLMGHLHAAVLSYRAIPPGELKLTSYLPELFENQNVVDLLHLLVDDHGLASQSLFSRGAMWLAPVKQGELP